jgi:predicted site-specific integrase-resolvase
MGRLAFDITKDPETGIVVVNQGDEITEELFSEIIRIGVESFSLIKTKCHTVTPVLEEVKKNRFTACHYVKEINDL